MQELKKFYFFEHLEEGQLQQLNSFAVKKKYKKGSILFYEKDMPTSLILLVEGNLKVYKTDQKNNEIIMNIFHPMTMIAEMVVLENVPYPASASFESDGAVIEINFQKFKKNFLNNPDISLLFFKSLSKKIKYLEKVIALNVVLNSTARLAKYIYDSEEPIKHYQLAEHLHMAPETLSRTFKKLMVLNLVEKTKKGYSIINRVGLQTLFE